MNEAKVNNGSDLLPEIEFKKWDVAWQIANANETGHKKFMFHNADTGSYYFKGSAMIHGSHVLSMDQTRKVTPVVFVDSMVGQALQANMNLADDHADRVIKADTGIQSVPISGAFVDIYVGPHMVKWTNDKSEQREDPMSTRSQFIAKGDDIQKTYDRVKRQVEKDEKWTPIKMDSDQAVADKINEQIQQ